MSDLISELVKMDYQYVIKPLTNRKKLINYFSVLFTGREKYQIEYFNDWVYRELNGKKIEVYLTDIWYVQIRILDVVVFDKRRFSKQEFFTELALWEHTLINGEFPTISVNLKINE